MDVLSRLFVVVGLAVCLSLVVLGTCEVYNKLRLGEHLRPTIQPIISNLDE